MALQRQFILPLLLVALHLLAVIAGGGHHHAHEHCHHDQSVAHSHASHAHSGGHCASHAHGQQAHAKPADGAELPSRDQHPPKHGDHDHCVVCQLLSQVAQTVSAAEVPTGEGTVCFLQWRYLPLVDSPTPASYQSRAPPAIA